MPLFSHNLGVDLGTERVRVAENGQTLLDEPTLVVVAVEERKIVAVGEEAEQMYGRVPETLEVIRPLQHGVVAYYEVTERLLAHLFRKAGSSWLFRPRVMMTVPYGATSVEHRAVQEAALQAGSREVYLIPTPLAAAIGADLPIGTPSGNMLVTLGAGATQAAVISMHGIVAAETLRLGGLDLDEAIIQYVRRKYGLIIGQPTAERVKLEIGAAVPLDEELALELQGQHQVTGLPQTFTLTTSEVVEALQDPLGDILEMVRGVIEKTPPELVSEIIDRGIALAGGTALLRGLDRLMTKELGVPAYLVDDPLNCAAIGAARALDILPVVRRSLVGAV
ncbi:MAG TPA: rod shape-determining protein [Anaerolineae bacterium]|nr:rod shape-determining protein [Anaerolineae bacterium]HIQ08358.1 rod shape-determining protein [Anaerolineaceae bacterium]